jgi:hypothetical protein
VAAQGAFSSSEINAAIKAQWTAAASGNVSLDAKSRDVLAGVNVKIYTIGVPGVLGFQDITDPIRDLSQVYQNGLQFSANNPGAPISFFARHITDATLAHVRVAAEYIQPISANAENIDQRFQVWDGPGGGLKDTGIVVAPGDEVIVTASGQVDAGVFATGTHGPEGWPGWRPHANAPYLRVDEILRRCWVDAYREQRGMACRWVVKGIGSLIFC